MGKEFSDRVPLYVERSAFVSARFCFVTGRPVCRMVDRGDSPPPDWFVGLERRIEGDSSRGVEG